jgi:trk system potassium uptake protein TrkH
VFLIYSGLTAAGIFALGILGAGWFDAVVHCFAAVSTGGFSSHDDSLASFSLPVQIAVTVTALACSVSLPLYWLSSRRPWRRLLTDPQLWTLFLCGGLATALLFALFATRGQMPWPEALGHAGLCAFSAQSTAGFSTVDISDLDNGSKLILIGSMAIGGGTGSTAGGFKVLRLLIVLHALQRIVFRTTLPKHAIESARLVGQRFAPEEREGALCIVALFVTTVVASWLPFVLAGFDPLDSLFEVVSATGTAGISVGISSPELPHFLKTVLCLDMLLGRVEFVALLVVLYPRTWLGRRMRSS